MGLPGDTSLIIDQHLPPAVTSWSHEPSEDLDEHLFQFHLPHLSFHLCLSANHQDLLSCQVQASSIRRRDLDPIRHDVRAIFHNLYYHQQNNDNDNDSSSSSKPSRLKELDIQVAILQALELLAEHQGALDHAAGRSTKYAKGWAADEISDWNDIVNNPFGLDASTVRDTASELVGMTPEQIVREIPPSWRVIHMESVIRDDLLRRFVHYQASLRSALEMTTTTTTAHVELRGKLSPHSRLEGRVQATLSRDDIVHDMVKPRLTFHGTPLKSVRSIIRHGFLLPGKVVDGRRVQSPRSGIAFNRGIYSSQSAAYAMSYAGGQAEQTPLGLLPSMRLFVCATIMGRTYGPRTAAAGGGGGGGSDSVHGPLVEGYDSHFDGGFEYIIHEERAMLPCYVIHLDLGSAEAQRAIKAAQLDPYAFHADFVASKKKNKDRTHPRLRDGPAPSPGDLKREQLAKKAAALKWFPYGFGSASGTRFLIEDIGEVSEDDEEYGEWQADKHAYIAPDAMDGQHDEGDTYESWDEEEGRFVTKTKKTGLFLDRYQGARREKRGKDQARHFGKFRCDD